MSDAIETAHKHTPLYRVVRESWPDPLDSSFAKREGGRWNMAGAFAALYVCCSEIVARAIAMEKLSRAALLLEDLQPEARPQLVEIEWTGRVIDVASSEGVEAAGLGADYPSGHEGHGLTQEKARQWYEEGREAVVCRSATLYRLGQKDWRPPHQAWGELAIFVAVATVPPELKRRRSDSDWLQ